jgi:pyruvate formate lyase activating enzyme
MKMSSRKALLQAWLAQRGDNPMEAYLYERLENGTLRCNLCNHRCLVKEGKRGICNVRENKSGVLNTLVYDKLIAWHVDPIEKKPLFHMMPGSRSYSIATVGCNFRCSFCQNSDIAQMPADRGMIQGKSAGPNEIVQAALDSHCQSISYTYTEPTIYFEFAYDTARIAHAAGLKNIFVSNGYMTEEALDMINPYLDAANIDLKAFTDEFYKTRCGARLEPVKQTLVHMKSRGIMVEVTTLLIPGLNDDKMQLELLAGFLADSLGTDTPWHISRFHPTYRLLDRPPTPVSTLSMARDIGLKAGLKYVYTGNVPGNEGENTFCPSCGEIAIKRWQYTIEKSNVRNGRCGNCGFEIYGVWH